MELTPLRPEFRGEVLYAAWLRIPYTTWGALDMVTGDVLTKVDDYMDMIEQFSGIYHGWRVEIQTWS